MNEMLRSSAVAILVIAIFLTQMLLCQGVDSEKNVILINEEKDHFACKTKDTQEYKLLPISALCDGVPDCAGEADETTDGCKRKEKILVQTVDDSKKMMYISEFRASIGRAVKKSASEGGGEGSLKELLRQYKLDHYITEHDDITTDEMAQNKV